MSANIIKYFVCRTKHAYMVFADEHSANAVLAHAEANPVELGGRQLIVRHYTEPPNHVPKGRTFLCLCCIDQNRNQYVLTCVRGFFKMICAI